MGDVDWEGLRERARELTYRAYAPYSGYPVGAAGLVEDGRTVSGTNVENASYGVALCAECGLVSDLWATGGGRLAAVSVANARGEVITPCGRCRQLLWEHGGPELLVDTPAGPSPLRELLAMPFGADDLEHLRRAEEPTP